MMKSFMKANPNGTQADYQKSLFGQNSSLGGADFSGVGSMNPTQYGSWMSQQNEGAMRQARQNFNPNFQAPRPQIIPTVDIFGTQVPGGTQSPYYNYNW